MMSTWCSKHVEAWNKLIVKQKFCASSWLITKINSSHLSVWPSVCPHETTRLPLDGFSRNLIFEYFSKILLENSSFMKTWQKIPGTLHEHNCTFMKISRWIFLRTINVSDKIFRENQKALFMFTNFLRKSYHLRDNVEKYVTDEQVT